MQYEAYQLVEPLLRGSHLAVERTVQPMMPKIKGDKNQIQEVFIALILNSYDSLKTNHTISITAHWAGQADLIEIIFADAAISDDERIFSKVSEPFFVIDNDKRKLQVSLPVIKEILDQHQGEIVELPGSGGKSKTFIIKLPVTRKLKEE